MTAFDPMAAPIGELDGRTLLISASAGTGKTWTVAHLATRWMLDDEANDPSRLLLVTYSRAAAAELRSRLRGRVVELGSALEDPSLASDDWMRSLADLPDAERARLRRRQAEVLASLDDVNARTIHSFSSMVGRRGSAATTAGDDLYDRAIDETLTSASLSDLDRLRMLAVDPTDPEASTGELSIDKLRRRLADALRSSASIGGFEERAQGGSKAILVAPGEEGDGQHRARALSFGSFLVDAERRLRELMAMENDVTFDELITGVYWEVQDQGSAAIESLRASFGFVLIDEFQDTDAAQWSIFESVFRGQMPVVIVGDPKQAIYGFRGGDVVIFQRLLAEARTDDDVLTWELERNFRSGERLVGQLNALLGIAEAPESRALWEGDDAMLELPRRWAYSSPTRRGGAEVQSIDYLAVDVGSDAQRAPERAGRIEIRDLTVERPLARRDASGSLLWDPAEHDLSQLRSRATAARDELLDDLVRVVRRLRDAGRSLDDICVLVRTNHLGKELREHLRRHGVPAVTTKTEPVFAAPAAEQLRCLLWSLTEPTNPRYGGLLEFTWFQHHDLEELASLSRTLETYGPGALCRRVLDTATMHEVLRSSEPERSWTDVDHLFGLLGEQFRGGVLATTALSWLEEMMAGSTEAKEDEAAVRRVESHGGSVTIMTVHSAKGLEFPVVLCPQIESGPQSSANSKQSGVLSTPEGREFDLGRMVADKIAEAGVGGMDEALQESDESARLIYVALTRAQDELVLWLTDHDRHQWSKSTIGPNKVLSTSLLRTVVESYLLSTEELRASVAERTAGRPFSADIEVIRPDPAQRTRGLDPVDAERKAIDLEGVADPPFVDESLRRWSYSSLHVHGTAATVADEVEEDVVDAGFDGGGLAEDVGGDEQAGQRLGSGLFGGHAGTSVGNALHEVFERVVGRPPLEARELEAVIVDTYASWGLRLEGEEAAEVRAQFDAMLSYPLGELLGDRSLLELGAGPGVRTANEMRFTIPLEGEGRPRDRLVEIGRIAHDAEPDGPYARFFAGIAEAALRPTRLFQGFLVGSLDLVVEAEDPQRFVVLDYKSNLLKEAESYAPAALVGEMALSGYPLQGLLYSVALHRFLDRRLPGYDPESHLGGICYFYLRGALLEGQGEGAGLATWRIPTSAVVGVSELLAGRRDV